MDPFTLLCRAQALLRSLPPGSRALYHARRAFDAARDLPCFPWTERAELLTFISSELDLAESRHSTRGIYGGAA